MCAAQQGFVSLSPIIDKKATTSRGVDMPGENGGVRYVPLSQSSVSGKSDISRFRNGFINLIKIPETSGIFEAKLRNFDPGAKILESRDIRFKFILNNIFNILDNSLSTRGYSYHVDVEHRALAGLKRVIISIYLENTSFDETLKIWKIVGNEISEFFDSLKEKPKDIWPTNVVDQLRLLIGVEFDSGD